MYCIVCTKPLANLKTYKAHSTRVHHQNPLLFGLFTKLKVTKEQRKLNRNISQRLRRANHNPKITNHTNPPTKRLKQKDENTRTEEESSAAVLKEKELFDLITSGLATERDWDIFMKINN